jgi:hypothetical protein
MRTILAELGADSTPGDAPAPDEPHGETGAPADYGPMIGVVTVPPRGPGIYATALPQT